MTTPTTAHTSCMVFWIGVPVSSNLFRQLKLSNTFQRILKEKICIIIFKLHVCTKCIYHIVGIISTHTYYVIEMGTYICVGYI